MRQGRLPHYWHQYQVQRQDLPVSTFPVSPKHEINRQPPKNQGLSSVWARMLEKHKQSSEQAEKAQNHRSMVVSINNSSKSYRQKQKNPKKVVITGKPPTEQKVKRRRGRPRIKGIFSRREFIISLAEVFNEQPIPITKPISSQNIEKRNRPSQACKYRNDTQNQSKVCPPAQGPQRQLQILNFTIELTQSKQAVEFHTQQAETNNETQFILNAQQNTKPQQVQNARPSQILIEDDSPQERPLSCSDPAIEIMSPKLPKALGKATLRELVYEIYSKQLISEPLYADFTASHSFSHILTFISKFYAGKLHEFDFQTIRFTLLDHRRISELLINLFPTEYFLGPLDSPHPKVLEFLEKMYELSGEEYYNLYYKIDNISRVKWWGKILIVQEERLSSSYKEKRVNQRRAERAKQAVEELIKSYKQKQKMDTDPSKTNIQS